MGAAPSSGPRRTRRRTPSSSAPSRRPTPRPRGLRPTGTQLGPAPGDLIIVSRAIASFGEALKTPQASVGRGRVIVDRRAASVPTVEPDRRSVPSTAAEAALRVLGFTVVPGRRPAPPNGPAKKPARRRRPSPAR